MRLGWSQGKGSSQKIERKQTQTHKPKGWKAVSRMHYRTVLHETGNPLPLKWPFFTAPNYRDAGRRPRHRTDSLESFQQGSWAIPETPAASISDMTASSADQDRGTHRHRQRGVRGEEAYTAPFGKASRVYNIPLAVQCRQSSAFAKAPSRL